MRGLPRATGLLVLLSMLTSCRAPANEAAHVAIGGDVAARVGPLDVPVRLVAALAAARGLVPSAALNLLVEDAVAAHGAELAHLDDDDAVRYARLAALGRATVDHVRADATSTPPSDDEVRAATAFHWSDVDCPETFEAFHAVALRPKTADASAEAAAREVALAIAKAEAGVTSVADFQSRANAVPHGKVEVVVQPLQPVTADGRIAVPGPPSVVDPKFAAGAAAIPAPGDVSGVVESSFGWHVIYLIARRPAVHLTLEERRTRFASEIYDHRAAAALASIEAAGASRHPVTRANGLDDLLAAALPAVRSGAP